ncbi:VapE domain-containing protein [uncultured Christiangramia sp.]|uniref:VapE domain-containing protein n=1 Tax=uncultured Christiangramia sp. TaxID=503836 RepID=UPI0026325B48|nr:VapE domain-containing protein [uncultured Christiangramia sp.]
MDKQILYTQKDSENNTIYDKIHQYISGKYNLLFNEISQEFIIKLKNSSVWIELNINSLIIELTKADLKVRRVILEIYLCSYLVKTINPFKQYYESLENWDGIDHIRELASYVPTDNDILFVYHLKKWLVRTIKCSIEPKYYNKNCLVFAQETQNSGKTTFCRFLCPDKLNHYYAENIGHDKDGIIQLAKNIIINLDELDKIDQRTVDAYKSFFSKETLNLRLPYAKKNSIHSRTSSFLGSTNLLNFLKDDTGNVRWICFEILGRINFDYSKNIDINKVWAQAYHLAYNTEDFNPDLTHTDVIENEKRNEKHRMISIEEELISELFEKSSDRNDFLTSTVISNYIKAKYSYANPIIIGRALRKLGYKRINSPENGNKGYMIKLKK